MEVSISGINFSIIFYLMRFNTNEICVQIFLAGVTSTVTKKTTTVSTATKSAPGATRTSGTALKPTTARTTSATSTGNLPFLS